MNFQALKKDLICLLEPIYGKREAENITNIYITDRFHPTDRSRELTIDEAAMFSEDSLNLLKGMPVQYIVGKAYFFEHFFKVSPAVLIPRAETEELVALAISSIMTSPQKKLKVLEIGTGSGCIAISLKKKYPDLLFDAIDISEDALSIARKNAESQQVEINLFKLDFLDRSAWSQLGEYDMVLSNPPYISSKEIELMPDNVLKYEPEAALFPKGEDPNIFYKEIFEFCKRHLKERGKIILEINQFQIETLKKHTDGFPDLEIDFHSDLQGNFRVLFAQKA